MRTFFVPALFLLLSGCGESGVPQSDPVPAGPADAPAIQAQNPYAGALVFSGANLWDGTGAVVLTDAVLVVKAGRIAEVLSGPPPDGAEVTDLAGSWIVPGFIDAHAHVSGYWAAEGVQGAEQKLRDELTLFARYGVTTVNSLGGEPAEARTIRDAQNDASLVHARLYMAGTVVADTEPLAAAKTTATNIMAGVDWVKIRVDDNLGTAEKMPWPAVEAVFDAAKARGARVATHVFYKEDAARLLELGTGLIAHSVRDQPLDDAFVARLLNSGVCYVPTLTREVSAFVYATRPEFFSDPFFQKAAKQSEVERVSKAQFIAQTAGSPLSAGYRKALMQAQDNLRIVIGSGVPVAFGTDAGPPGRFPGYFEHLEFQLMREAGLTPSEILLSATSVAADCLGLNDVGSLTVGKWADFVVLSKSPLDDILATRSIQSVYIAGNRVRD